MREHPRVGVRELRQNLSKWLRRVEAGETFEVTKRRVPIALLAPLPRRSVALQRLVSEARLVQIGTGLGALAPPRGVPSEGAPKIDDAVRY